MSEPRLAGIIYGEGEGPKIDDLLVALVEQLRSKNVRLGGAIQHNTEGGDRCRCDMTLEDLGSGARVDISERRGPESRGCRLDSFALETCVGLVLENLSPDRDLVVINRFGKREAEGHGFRQVIERAMELGVPVVVGVAKGQRPAWQDFTGSYAETLAADIEPVLAWCLAVAGGGEAGCDEPARVKGQRKPASAAS